MNNKITFERVDRSHKSVIFEWLSKPHVMEFWDNTDDHKNDILNFMDGRSKPSNYADGLYVYWVAKMDDVPFGFIMTIEEKLEYTYLDQIRLDHISKTGSTYTLEFMIGSVSHLGKGYSAETLKCFMEFFRSEVDIKADTFFIDPKYDNKKALYVYQKAGFEYIDDYILKGSDCFAGQLHSFMIKKFV